MAKSVFTIQPDLVFDQSYGEGSFKPFVDGLLAKPASHRIRRFSLKLTDCDASEYILVNECLRNVVKRGVMVLELDIKVERDYSLPLEVLLPCLKTLSLDFVMFKGRHGCCVFQRLVYFFPVLEELVMDRVKWEHWDWSRIVSSQILKRLTIWRGNEDEDEESWDEDVESWDEDEENWEEDEEIWEEDGDEISGVTKSISTSAPIVGCLSLNYS